MKPMRARPRRMEAATAQPSRAVGFGYAGDQPAAGPHRAWSERPLLTRHMSVMRCVLAVYHLVALLRRSLLREGNRQGLMTEKAGVLRDSEDLACPTHHSRGELSPTLSAPPALNRGEQYIEHACDR